MVDGINNAIQIFNELVVLLCIQSMFLFTNYVPEAQTRYDMGRKLLYLVLANISLNLIVLILSLLIKICKAGRNWYIKRQNRIAVEKANKRGAVKSAIRPINRRKRILLHNRAPKVSFKLPMDGNTGHANHCTDNKTSLEDLYESLYEQRDTRPRINTSKRM